jgi:sugar transferase (PEP-CTERM/EpsH1 system associated)
VKILAILPRFPYPVDKGDKLRAFHHIKYLAEHHEVSVFALSDEPVSNESLNVLKSFCRNVVVFPLSKSGIFSRLPLNAFSHIPFQTAWHFDATAEKLLLAEIEKTQPDVLFYQLVRTAEFAKHVNLPKVLDLQDPMSENIRLRMNKEPLWKRQVFRMEYKRLLSYETEVAQRFDEICIISERDRKDLPEVAKAKAKIVSNGIDTEYYQPQFNITKTVDLVFVGSMSYVPNIEAARFLVKEILPELVKLGICATVSIVGANPSAEVKALANENITVTGRVPDTRTYYAQARVMVAPMFINTGIQNKILEAAAMGLPVVTTPQANEPIGAEPGTELLLASTAVEFAKQIALLLNNETVAEAIANAGHDFILSKFTWKACGKQLEELLVAAKSGY